MNIQFAWSQELNCTVEVNTDAIEGTYHHIFENLRHDISEYINETKWTDLNFSSNERIECRLFLTVNEYSADRIKGDLQVQLSRPVFNSTYATTLLNYKDTQIEFEYKDGDRIVRNDNGWNGNLSGLLDFYAYLMIALDSDSFSLRGGQELYDKASSVVAMAQSSGEPGWKTFEDNRNRSAVINVFTEPSTAAIRDVIYNYHRKGLDEMTASPDKGRKTITESLKILDKIYDSAPMSVVFPIIRDAKLEELVNVYSKAGDEERMDAYEILSRIYPADEERLQLIRQPGI